MAEKKLPSVTDELLGGGVRTLSAPKQSTTSVTDELIGGRQMRVPVSQPPLSVNPAMGADFITALKAGIPLNQQDAIKSFAASRRIPESRYTVIDGKIAYRADDGKYYPEVPNFMQRPSTNLGYVTPDILEAVPDIGVGIATAPLSPAVSIPATAATAAGSNLARQGISKLMTGSNIEAFPAVLSGFFGGLGELAPVGAKAVRERATARDIANISQGTNARDIETLMRNAKQFNINLTPAEITNLPSLKQQQKVLGNVETSSDQLNKFYTKRYQEQVQPAIDEFLSGISPTGEAIEAGLKGQKALQEAEQNLIKQRKEATEPIFKAAFDRSVPVDSSPVISQVDKMLEIAKGKERDALLSVRKNLFREKEALDSQGNKTTITAVEDRLPALQRAKFDLDAFMRSDAGSSMDATIQQEMNGLKNTLLEQMGKDNPDYLAANAKFEELSAPLNEFRERKTGLSLTKMSPDNLNQFASRLFENADPATIRYARKQIESVNPDAWKAVTRSHLQNNWEKASKVSAGAKDVKIDAGANWNNLLFGDAKTRKSLQAALDSKEYQALTDLAAVLQAAGRVQKLGSDTAFNQLVMEELIKNPPVTGIASGGARAIGYLGQPLQYTKAIGDWGRRKDAAVNAKEYADIITSPDAMKKLRQLRQLSPTSAKFVAGLSQLGTQYGIIGQEPMSESDLQIMQEQ
jgi:hypothetical protein